MKKILLFTALIVGMTVQAQEKEENTPEKSPKKEPPKGNWTVNKTYDDDGNLIAKDSVYTYSYSTHNEQEVSPKEIDSIRRFMEERMAMNFDAMNLAKGFDLDSIQQSFFGNEFGGDIGEIQERMRKEMEALRNQFFGEESHSRSIPKEHQPNDSAKEEESTSLEQI